MPHVLPLLLDHPPVGARVRPRLDTRGFTGGRRTIGSSGGCFDVLAKVHSPTYSAIVAQRRFSRATWVYCWNRLRTECAGFCCVLLRSVQRLEADYRKSSSLYRSGPTKAGSEQISPEQSRDVTSALVISKGKEIKVDFLSSRYEGSRDTSAKYRRSIDG